MTCCIILVFAIATQSIVIDGMMNVGQVCSARPMEPSTTEYPSCLPTRAHPIRLAHPLSYVPCGAQCLFDRTVDDTGFIDALISLLQTRHPIDPDRVYAVGFSNGGMMSMQLACHLSHRIAAFGLVSPGPLVPWRWPRRTDARLRIAACA